MPSTDARELQAAFFLAVFASILVSGCAAVAAGAGAAGGYAAAKDMEDGKLIDSAPR